MTDDVIYIVTEDRPEASPGEKGLLDRIGLKQVPVDPKKLEIEWNRMLRVVGKLLAQAEQQVGGESDERLAHYQQQYLEATRRHYPVSDSDRRNLQHLQQVLQ
ncbi:MAG: hypothetical protein ACP5RH_22605, partial [Leptodesmis sp.]|uniref:hypothetical protein n=1 Tax=Leptodesmis sp. TaxID=3100501 RepID=UPI003D0D936C